MSSLYYSEHMTLRGSLNAASSHCRAFCFPPPSRYGEHSTPFCVSVVESCQRGDKEFSRRIHDAVERASLDIPSGSSSDEEDGGGDNSLSSSNGSLSSFYPPPSTNPERKTIPTVSNPNSVYRVGCYRKMANAKSYKVNECK